MYRHMHSICRYKLSLYLICFSIVLSQLDYSVAIIDKVMHAVAILNLKLLL